MINKDRLVKNFLQLVQIDSPSGEEDAIAQELFRQLQALGASVQTDPYGNIIGKFDGKGTPLLLNAHMDTVEPGRGVKPIIKDDRISSDGTTILGADPKAGIAAIVEALTSVVEDKKAHLPIEVVFTRGEESGLNGARNLDYSLISAKRAVTFDGEDNVNTLNIDGPGYYRVDATIIGRGSHAGAAPEKGISAIRIASEIIANLPLGRLDEESSANIGLIEGGTARNAIPERTTIKGEIRSRNKAKLENFRNEFERVFTNTIKKYPLAKLDLAIVLEFGPYKLDSENETVKQIINSLKIIGLTAKIEHSGGGTDAHMLNSHGIEAIVVGAAEFEPHTTREYTKISSLLKVSQFCEQLILCP